MNVRYFAGKLMFAPAIFVLWSVTAGAQASVAETITGQVLGANAPISGSTVTLWAASTDAPKQLALAKTDDNGRLQLNGHPGQGAVLYLIASGRVAINELATTLT